MRLRRPRYVWFWAHYFSWWLWYVALVACGVIFAIWLFVGGHWLIGLASTAITIWWTTRVVIETGFARFVAKRITKPS
jgi:hypothetical protein